ncbi:hypothetical protein BDV96DRAFT_600955 [Lophiotrema nucula]|uniref:Putative zinc-finger domain-containing protein n=1 Tax=Lophiotrema nucula TaxID=690887 RepID=A0A6A5Z761_9PLEO|nr:hypothetical protein BDV96DRAFT_600955 [Lophiotrema nucula]
MANYSQPPYGLPFAPAPQQYYPQQAAAGTPDGQPPTMPDNLQYPGLNLQQFAQNNQQQQYPFWPPPPLSTPNTYPTMPYPPPFMAQNGVIPPPPVPPNFPFSPVPQLPFQNAAAPTPPPAQLVAPFQQTQPLATLTNDRIAEVMDSDKEEGEVSDGDRVSQSPAIIGKAKSQPEPPRSVPNTHPKGEDGGALRTNGSGTPTSNTTTQRQLVPSIPQASQQTVPANEMASLPTQRAAAADFVKLLHENSVGYPVLASEGLDGQLLEGLYRGLNLPMHTVPARMPDRPTASLSNATDNPLSPATQPNATPRPAKPSTAIKTNIASARLTKKAPSPIEPAPAKDRGSYVAALAAARAKNAALAAASKGASPTTLQAPAKVIPSQVASPPAPQPARVPAPAVQSIATPPTTSANTRRPVESDAEKARKTELLRQKLEAFKAKQALKKADSASGAATPSAVTHPELLQAMITQTGQPTQTSQGPLTPTFSGIPGLFMGTSASNGTMQTQELQTPPPPSAAIPRKRPVAADFDEISTPRSQGPMYTRPLGQSPHEHDEESMIIEVSDDDSDDQDMDLDDEEGPPAKRRGVSSPRSGVFGQMQNPVLPDFPHSASAFPFPSGVNTPGMEAQTAFAYKQLEQTENEIARLKREIELKSKVGSRTVAIKKTAQMPYQAGLSNQNERPSSSTETAQQLQDPQTPPRTSQDITPQRRSEIESELASLESKMETAKAKESELQQQVAAVKAAQSQYLQNKAFLLKQLEILQAISEPEPSSEVQTLQPEVQQTELPRAEETRVDELPSDADQAMLDADETVKQNEGPVEKASPIEVANTNGIITSTGSEVAPPAIPSTHLPGIAASITENADSATPVLPIDKPVSRNVLEAANDTSIVEAHPDTNGGVVNSNAADDEDFYSPEPEIAPIPEQPAGTQEHSAAARSPSEEGELEMSESPQSEEEYEPAEPPMSVAQVPAPEDDAMEIANSPTSSLEPSTTDDEEEAYEPPDVAEEITNHPTDSAPTVPIPDAQVMSVDEPGAMDISMSSSEDSDSDDSSSEPPPALFISSSNAKSGSVGFADDLAPELQSQTVPATQTVLAEQLSHVDDESIAFVPYESPLRMFKSYRYHKDFTNEVPGSFQSLTYSHQIDPSKPLCRFEADGGMCNDSQCDGQHFGGMGITGEKLLVQLGTANPGKTVQERQQWTLGLRGVLKELRQNSIKDPCAIADEIAKYRRKFLNDDTRVVNL